MKAMILAAGRGTRLAPLTDSTPKPMLPLAGKPLLEWQITALVAAGIHDFVINLHHLGEQIEAYLGDGRQFGAHIRYSYEAELLETGGGIKRALPMLGTEPFLLLNGDIYTDFDFTKLPPRAPEPGGAHIVLTATPAYRSAGDFDFADGRVTARGGSYVYCGIAVLDASLFDNHTQASFSMRDLYFALIPHGQLSAQVHRGEWHDIGTLEQYHALAAALARD